MQDVLCGIGILHAFVGGWEHKTLPPVPVLRLRGTIPACTASAPRILLRRSRNAAAYLASAGTLCAGVTAGDIEERPAQRVCAPTGVIVWPSISQEERSSPPPIACYRGSRIPWAPRGMAPASISPSFRRMRRGRAVPVRRRRPALRLRGAGPAGSDRPRVARLRPRSRPGAALRLSRPWPVRARPPGCASIPPSC